MNQSLIKQEVESRILMMRNKEVMLDTDIAEMYEVSTSELNRKIKSNEKKFSSDLYMFELTEEEKKEIISKYTRLEKLKYSSYKHKAFTEYGVIMISTILNTDLAIQICHIIVETFIQVKKQQKTVEELKKEIDFLKKELQEQSHQFSMHFQVIFREIQNLKKQLDTEDKIATNQNQIGFIPPNLEKGE